MLIWIIFAGIMLVSLIIQQVLNRKIDKYSQVPSPHGLSGADISKLMLQQNNINNVTVQSVGGKLTDNFNPSDMTINLSEPVYSKASIAACAIAAHETGHAVQNARGYAPVKLRSALVPVVNFANNAVQWVLLAGIIFINVFPHLIWAGIILFAITTLFSLVTLPVEINASQRAVQWLSGSGVVDETTRPMVEDALKWAAYTYVIAAVGSIATLLYYILIAERRN